MRKSDFSVVAPWDGQLIKVIIIYIRRTVNVERMWNSFAQKSSPSERTVR